MIIEKNRSPLLVKEIPNQAIIEKAPGFSQILTGLINHVKSILKDKMKPEIFHTQR